MKENEIFLIGESISGIYKITNNKNNKVYIGLSKNIRKRLIAHISQLRLGKHYNNHLLGAYKIDSEYFSYDILEVCDHSQLCSREVYWISFYDSMNDRLGYNLTSGGEESFLVSEHTRIKISKSKVGKYCGENNVMYGKTHTADARMKIGRASSNRDPIVYEKMSKSLTGRAMSLEQKENIRNGLLLKSGGAKKTKIQKEQHNIPVYCFELDEIFRSASDAEKKLNINHSRIAHCCKNTDRMAQGTHWRYLKDVIGGISQDRIEKFLNPKTIYCVELNKYFSTVDDAADFVVVEKSTLRSCCWGKGAKTCGGYHWKVIDIADRYI